jgi:LasA protease
VKRGQVLGFTSTRAGCGGSATGAHVHFTVKYRGDPVNIRGMSIGGWIVREGTSPYVGCLVRDGARRCSPGGRVRNFGV